MVDPSEARNHQVDQNDDTELNLAGSELQAMIDTAINEAVDRVLKDHKRKCNNTPNKGCKKGKAGSSQIRQNPNVKPARRSTSENASMNRPRDVAFVRKWITRLMNAGT